MVRRKTDRNRFPASGAVAHLYGRLCKCRKRFSAGVAGGAPLPGDAAAPEEKTMPTEFFENVEAPRKAVLAAVDTGEYDV